MAPWYSIPQHVSTVIVHASILMLALKVQYVRILVEN